MFYNNFNKRGDKMPEIKLINERLSKSVYDSLVYSDGLSVDAIISEMFNAIMKYERDQFLEMSRNLGLDLSTLHF